MYVQYDTGILRFAQHDNPRFPLSASNREDSITRRDLAAGSVPRFDSKPRMVVPGNYPQMAGRPPIVEKASIYTCILIISMLFIALTIDLNKEDEAR